MVTQERPRVRCASDWQPRPTLTGARLHEPGGLRGGARAPVLPRLVLHRPRGRGPGAGRLPRPRRRRRVGVRRSATATASCGRSTTSAPTAARSSSTTSRPAASLGKALKCPYHAWSYDFDGRLLATPNVHEDEQFERADYPLHSVAVGEHAGFLFVSLADAPGPARRLAPQQQRDDHRLRSLPDGRAAPRPADHVRRRRELEDRRRELQRVPPLPDDPPRARPGHPALSARARSGTARRATAAT